MTDDPRSRYLADRRALIEAALAESVTGDHPPELYDPARYVMAGQGKRFRPLLVLIAADVYGLDAPAALPGATAVEMFHNFTLVHDDIMDHADSRRGRPTVHVRWDEPTAILVGDLLMGLSYDHLTHLPAASVPRAIAAFGRMVRRLCEGQMLDMAFENRNDVSVDDYLYMIDRKTGALIGCALELGAIAAGADEAAAASLYEIGERTGRAFQIQDDLLDLTADSASWGKQIGGDILEGKRTFLLLTALARATGADRSRLEAVLAGEATASDIDPIRDMMDHIGALSETRDAVIFHSDRAIALAEDLPAGTARDILVDIIRRMQARVH